MSASLAQQEFCANGVHDWKYRTPEERTCKCCGVKHVYEQGSEWVKAPLQPKPCPTLSTEN
jgi:hypothetical protein